MTSNYYDKIFREDIDELLLTAGYAPLQINNPIELRLYKSFTSSQVRPEDARYAELRKAMDQAATIINQSNSILGEFNAFKDLTNEKKVIADSSETFFFYPPNQPDSEWHRCVRDIEAQNPGPRLAISPELSSLTIPETVRYRFAQTMEMSEAETRTLLEARAARRMEWEKQVAFWNHRDIFEIANLRANLRGLPFRGFIEVTKEERMRWVSDLLVQLDRFPLYNIGFSYTPINDHILIKAGKVVMFNSRKDQPSYTYKRLIGVVIRGAEVVAQFKHDFDKLWETCITDPKEVRELIKREVETAGLGVI